MTTSNPQTKPHIGFIGIGHMGEPIALRLLQAGYPTTIYDRTKEKTQELAQQGATVATSPRDLAQQSDIIISCVTDNHALNSVMHGPDGAIAGAHTGSIFIDMSTVSPQESRHIAEQVKEKGASMLDAALSSSTPQVKEGTLVIFIGGEQEIYQRCKPILETLAKSVIYIGSNGMGTTMKLVVNSVLGLELQALAEATALGEKAGLEKNLLLDVLAQTSVIAPAHKAKLENVRQEEYPVTFALSLMRKDFSLIMRLATELSVCMPATAVTEQMYAAALAQGLNKDYSAMFQFMQKLSGISSLVHT